MNRIMKRLLLAALLATLAIQLPAGGQEIALEAGWDNPPLEARTRCFWWWLNGNVTKEAITRDLEEMRAKGMGGGLIFDADGSGQRGNQRCPLGPCSARKPGGNCLSTRSTKRIGSGLELSLLIQSGWNLGGPDMTPDEMAKQITWSELDVSSPGPLQKPLPQPSSRFDYYRDVAVLAIRNKVRVGGRPDADLRGLIERSNQQGSSASLAVDGDASTFWVSQGVQPGQGPGKGKSEWLGGKLQYADNGCRSSACLDGRTMGRNVVGCSPRKDGRAFEPVTEEIAVPNGEPLQVRVRSRSRLRQFRLEMMRRLRCLAFPASPRNVQVCEFTLLDADGRSLNPKSSPARFAT